MRDFRYMMVVAVAAAGLALAGCGSDGGPSQAELTAQKDLVTTLQGQINALRAQLGLAEDDDLGDSIQELQDEVADLEDQLEEKQDDNMEATAAKLYAGISAPMGDPASPAANDRAARYDTTNATTIEVFIGDGSSPPEPITLSEDKKAMVPANHGWEGKRYADPAGGDMVEAYVYSNVGAPKEGPKFNSGIGDGNVGFALNGTTGAVTMNADLAQGDAATRIASPMFVHSAGTKTFDLPDDNPGGETMIPIVGSYYGVAGTYTCTPATGACVVSREANGYSFDNPTAWTFKPTDPNARVMSTADTAYASYGWWLRKAANDGPWTASAFVDEKDTVDAAENLNELNGTATYQGGAAGKYALASSTGGTNDAGHFTARATLEANFNGTETTANAITGMIDQFMVGDDGEARDWLVKLNGSTIGNTGMIGAASNGTEWTIDGTAAAKSGQWSGFLRNNGTDGVPQVATGTFYTEYGTAGKMVGAFGANKQ